MVSVFISFLVNLTGFSIWINVLIKSNYHLYAIHMSSRLLLLMSIAQWKPTIFFYFIILIKIKVFFCHGSWNLNSLVIKFYVIDPIKWLIFQFYFAYLRCTLYQICNGSNNNNKQFKHNFDLFTIIYVVWSYSWNDWCCNDTKIPTFNCIYMQIVFFQSI